MNFDKDITVLAHIYFFMSVLLIYNLLSINFSIKYTSAAAYEYMFNIYKLFMEVG